MEANPALAISGKPDRRSTSVRPSFRFAQDSASLRDNRVPHWFGNSSTPALLTISPSAIPHHFAGPLRIARASSLARGCTGASPPPLLRYPPKILDFFRRPQHGVKGGRKKISPQENTTKGDHIMNVYESITQQIIDQLEQGTVPWRRPWRTRGVPRNLLSLKPYRGINVWLLLSRPYASPYWLTFRQANEIGGTVRKGEKGTTVMFWKLPDERTIEEA